MASHFSCFVTGTDTNVGKTLIAAALLHKCRAHGWRSVGMKPVASGCTQYVDGTWRNEDVEALAAASSIRGDRALVNPYLLREAIAPHLAADHVGVHIDPKVIMDSYRQLSEQADAVIVEGAGGFLVPLAGDFDSGDLARNLGLPVVLTVGMRLGCINHALLTQDAIVTRGLKLAGWVANCMERDMACLEENLASLKQRLHAPLLGTVPFMEAPDPVKASEYLALPFQDSL